LGEKCLLRWVLKFALMKNEKEKIVEFYSPEEQSRGEKKK